jgi:hypothetical protein
MKYNSFSCMFISILYKFRAAMCHNQENQLYQYDIWFMSLCMDDGLVCTCIYSERHIPDVVLIQLILMMMAHGCPKHVQNTNKHIWKKIVCHVGYLQESYWDARSTEHNKPTILLILLSLKRKLCFLLPPLF